MTDVAASPVAGDERYVALDTLRGVAVLGILAMNIYAFAMPFPAYGNPLLLGGTEWYNLGTWFFTHLFFDLKFMAIFSMLFGAGIIVMSDRAEARGSNFRQLHFRRQRWLLLFGALHGYLLWTGDILFHYALTAMLVVGLRGRSPRALIVIALLLMPVGLITLSSAGGILADMRDEAASVAALEASGEVLSEEQLGARDRWEGARASVMPTDDDLAAEIRAYQGSYTEIVRHRAAETFANQTDGYLAFMLWRVAGLMLIGMALMKLGIISGQRNPTFYRRMLIIGYGIGLPLVALGAAMQYQAAWDAFYVFRIGMTPNYIGSVFVALGHIAAVILIVKSGMLAGLMSRFTAVGRMAFTNYLMHSLVMTTIFYGYGFGLFGQVERLTQMGFVVGMLAVQLWYSPLWLRHYRFGPAEWLWRSLAYRQLQPMRKQSMSGVS